MNLEILKLSLQLLADALSIELLALVLLRGLLLSGEVLPQLPLEFFVLGLAIMLNRQVLLEVVDFCLLLAEHFGINLYNVNEGEKKERQKCQL